jgi:Tfp pilus assembly protein PilN
VFLLIVYVGFGTAIGALIWRQERRKDRQAQVLGLAPGRSSIGILVLVLSSAILAIVPTVIVWALLLPLR